MRLGDLFEFFRVVACTLEPVLYRADSDRLTA